MVHWKEYYILIISKGISKTRKTNLSWFSKDEILAGNPNQEFPTVIVCLLVIQVSITISYIENEGKGALESEATTSKVSKKCYFIKTTWVR